MGRAAEIKGHTRTSGAPGVDVKSKLNFNLSYNSANKLLEAGMQQSVSVEHTSGIAHDTLGHKGVAKAGSKMEEKKNRM